MLITKIQPQININHPLKSTGVIFQKKMVDDYYIKVGETGIKRKIGPVSYANETAGVYKLPTEINGHCEKFAIIDKNKNILGDVQIEKYQDHIYIADLESYARKTHKGIGGSLVQIAVEKSLEHTQCGEVRLRARKLHLFQLSPVNFYKKLGFREIKQSDEETENYGLHMSLHSKESIYWINKLKKPILDRQFTSIA